MITNCFYGIKNGFDSCINGGMSSMEVNGKWYCEIHGPPAALEERQKEDRKDDVSANTPPVDPDDAIHLTTFEIQVLSRGPLDLAQRDDDPFQLLAINYEIVEGECVGMVDEKDSTIVPPERVADALRSLGNDGEFFDEL